MKNFVCKNEEDLYPIKVKTEIPKRRQEVLNVTGWGFKDSKFEYKNETLRFTGNR